MMPLLASSIQTARHAVRDGHLMNLVDAPNRYGLPLSTSCTVGFERSQGAFADWNTHVTCESSR